MLLALVIIIVGLIAGSDEIGAAGVLAVVLMAGAFELVYAGIGMSVALRPVIRRRPRWGFCVLSLLFLSPAFAPKEVYAPWLEFLATINPVTYVLEGMRSLVLVAGSGEACLRGAGHRGLGHSR
jgi:ABC-2 type transport system permease protein